MIGEILMKKLISVILTMAICLLSIAPTPVKAASNETLQEKSIDVLALKKDNFNYLEGKIGETHLVYTYDSNGSTYKVVENASENFDEVNSTIFAENSDGTFEEFATQHLTVENSILTHTTNISVTNIVYGDGYEE